MRFITSILFLILVNITALSQSKITSPEEFLGYELGTKFTRHHQVVDYFKLLESESNGRMKIVPYGLTNEGRPLFTAILSSQENMNRLEEIRTNNLKRTGLMEGSAKSLGIAIVWLSYNVHGDEPVSTEAALKTIYKLLDPSDADSKKWLSNTVVIMDPCINPDGRERYVQFYTQFRQSPVNPHPEAFSHNQQWPSGRTNHYLFDLNRDWVWQTQVETQQRLDLYHQWMPHIHVDFHEQGFNSPYYFAPGAEPYHKVITDWQREFQVTIGKNHAKYFDQNYWGYFTGEVFDLLYPSYGDTYPTFNGAIGMTYEQGGSAEGGTAVITQYGDTLTLSDRVEHHFTTGFSTVEIASMNSSMLEDEFERYYSNTNAGTYQAYLISGNNPAGKVAGLLTLLEKHRIKFGLRSGNRSIKGQSFGSSEVTSITLQENDIIIPVNQPKARLITALFEPETFVFDSVTYDLTAWNLPLAYGLEGASVSTVPDFTLQDTYTVAAAPSVSGTDYGYLLPYTSISSGRALAQLLDAGVKVGVADLPFEMNNTAYPQGTLIVLKGNNLDINLGKVLSDIQSATSESFIPVSTGYTPRGIDLGSNRVRKLKKKRVGILAGDGTSPNNVGEVWHFFEKELEYPVTLIAVSDIPRVPLKGYDVIIMPEGSYSGMNSGLDKIKEWVKDGGQLIAIGSAIRKFADEEDSSIQTRVDEEETMKETFENVGAYGMRFRENASESIPGAIFEITLDNTHPLGYGYEKSYYTLKTSSFGPVKMTSGDVVGQMKKELKPVNGFAGNKALDKLSESVVFGTHRSGNGSITLLVDNTLLRAFWENGKLIVVNAVFMQY